MFLHGDQFAVTKRTPTLERDARIGIGITPRVAGHGPDRDVARRALSELRYIGQEKDVLRLLLWGERRARRPTWLESAPGPPVAPAATATTSRGSSSIPGHGSTTCARQTSCSGPASTATSRRWSPGRRPPVFAHDARTLELARYFEIPHRVMADVPPDVDAADLYAEADYGPLLDRPRRALPNLHRLPGAARAPARLRARPGSDRLRSADRRRPLPAGRQAPAQPAAPQRRSAERGGSPDGSARWRPGRRPRPDGRPGGHDGQAGSPSSASWPGGGPIRGGKATDPTLDRGIVASRHRERGPRRCRCRPHRPARRRSPASRNARSRPRAGCRPARRPLPRPRSGCIRPRRRPSHHPRRR